MTGQPLQVTGEKRLMDKGLISASSDTRPPIGRGEIKENTNNDSLDKAVKEAPDIFAKEIIPTLIQINKAFKGNKKELEKLYTQWGKSLMTFAAPKNPGGPSFLAHTKQKVSNIVGLTALRLAFFMGYE